MRKLYTLIFLCIAFYAYAQQDIQLKITYANQNDFGDDPAEMAEQHHLTLQQAKEVYDNARNEIHTYELWIKNEKSKFIYIEKIENDLHNGIYFSLIYTMGKETIYKDVDQSTYLKEKELMNKSYLIKDSLKKEEWKITREKKKILGFTCRKATYDTENRKYVAWFTTEIPLKHGPHEYWGLPGLILETEWETTSLKDAERKYKSKTYAVALEVIKEDFEIEFPTNKNTVTKKEYKKERDEAYKRIEEMHNEGVDTSD